MTKQRCITIWCCFVYAPQCPTRRTWVIVPLPEFTSQPPLRLKSFRLPLGSFLFVVRPHIEEDKSVFLKRIVSLKIVSNALLIQQFAQLEILVIIQVVKSRLKVEHEFPHSVEVFFTGSRVVSCGHWLNVALVKLHKRPTGHHLKEVLPSETVHNLVDEEINQFIGFFGVEHDNATLKTNKLGYFQSPTIWYALH